MRDRTTPAPRPSRAACRAAVLAAAATGLLALAAPAAAEPPSGPPSDVDSGPAPAELELTLTGPGTVTAGGTGAWRIDLRNADDHAATDLRVELELPDDAEVASAQPADGWTCVLEPLSCSLDGALPPGASAEPLLVELAWSESAEGRRTVAVVAYQGEGTGAVRLDRAPARVTVEPAEPAPSEPPAEPTEQPAPPVEEPVGTPDDAVDAPATAAPAPAPRRTTTRTAPRTTAPAPAPEETAAPAEVVPETLPFADDATASPTPSASPRPLRAAAPLEPGDDGGSGALLALLGLGGLVAASGLAFVLVRARRAA